MDIPKHITAKFLRENPNVVFVFGDNLLHKGKGGAAKLRDEPNAYGFVTKRAPNNLNSSFFTPGDYWHTFLQELSNLHEEILKHPDRTYVISRIGAGLANKYSIYEKTIVPGMQILRGLKNVVFL